MEKVKRAHPAETGDSSADICPDCNGQGRYPAGTQRAGQTCALCAGSGFLLRQRLDHNGNPTRVALSDASDTESDSGAATGTVSGSESIGSSGAPANTSGTAGASRRK